MMRVALFERGALAHERAKVLRELGQPGNYSIELSLIPPLDESDDESVLNRVPVGSGVLFCAHGIRHYAQLAEIARRGMHLFLEWPPASSVAECRALAELSEEAGVEIGVSRPLRFQTLPRPDLEDAHLSVVSIEQSFDVRTRGGWKRALEDAVDLALLFGRNASPRRIDAAVARSGDRVPLSTTAGIRFHNGTYAHLTIRHRPEFEPQMHIHLAGNGFALDLDASAAGPEGVRRETRAFVESIAANRPPPVSVLDALQTIRLVEKLMERLRK